jgi:phosphatidylserine/phosphatidylglycerophosphate/cardiolipin synthase-like enzyme
MSERSTIPLDRLITALEQRRTAIVDVIRHARRRITLSLFRCNDRVIFEELAAATDRGVLVEVLVTSRVKGGRKKIEKLWNALEKTGAVVKAYTDPVVKYHPKYLVADDGPAIVATLNLTKKCFRKTCDALVVTHDPAVVAGLRALWDADRAGQAMPPEITERLIVGPERARRQFTALIEQARRSIRLIDAKLSDPDLVSMINARRGAGIDVEVFSGKRAAGLKSHGKILLIDDRTVVVGSLALAALSLDFRREVAIVVQEPTAVETAIDLFNSVRDRAASDGQPTPRTGDEASC